MRPDVCTAAADGSIDWTPTPAGPRFPKLTPFQFDGEDGWWESRDADR